MGLDNGVVLRITNKNNYNKAYKLFRHESWDKENECDVAYWRKCWGVRNAILGLFESPKINDGEYLITKDNISDIIKVFKYFLRKDHWEREADSIWEWDKYTKRNQIANLLNLYKLKWWLNAHPDDSAYFYDSY